MKKIKSMIRIFSIPIAILILVFLMIISYCFHQQFYNTEFQYIDYILALLGINLTILTLLLALKDANPIVKLIWKKGQFQISVFLLSFEIIGICILPFLSNCPMYIFFLTNLSTVTIASTGLSLLKMLKVEKHFDGLNDLSLDTTYKKNINLMASLLIEIKEAIKKEKNNEK